MQLKTERLMLREFRTTDIDAVNEYGSDPEVVTFMPWGPNTSEETRDFIDLCITQQTEDPRRSFELAIQIIEENKLIGGCGIKVSLQVNSEGNIGYCLNRDYWGRGVATKASHELLKYGFEELRLHRIYARAPSSFS